MEDIIRIELRDLRKRTMRSRMRILMRRRRKQRMVI
jgi:hypothetical protein